MVRRFVPLLLCFLCFLSDLSVSSIRLPGLDGGDKITHRSVRIEQRGSSVKFDPTRVTQLAWRPRAFLYKGFLSEKECDHLINLAKDKLEKSMVADNESGKSIESEVRTSSGMFLNKAQDEIVLKLKTNATWTFLPIENGEVYTQYCTMRMVRSMNHILILHDKVIKFWGGLGLHCIDVLSKLRKGGERETIFPNSE
ncbi:hypothetical protein SESBI_49251, partial [Sesbania bispinosa]